MWSGWWDGYQNLLHWDGYHQQWPYFENTLNSKKGYVESSSTKIEDEDVAFTSNLLVKTISDHSSCRLVDDLKDAHSQNSSSVLCGLPLRVVEVSRHWWQVVNGCSRVDHWKNFIGWLDIEKVNTGRKWGKDTTYKFFIFAVIFNTDIWFASLAEDIVWWWLSVVKVEPGKIKKI